MTRRGALLTALLLLTVAGLGRRAVARWRPAEVPLACSEVVSIVEAAGERVACRTDPALAACPSIQPGRLYRDCTDLGPMRGALLRTHGAPIDLAAATEDDLRSLPGVGPDLAARILKARTEAPLCNADDLLRVSGVGSRRLKAFQGLVSSSDVRCAHAGPTVDSTVTR